MRECSGLPPTGCSATGTASRLSASRMGVCVECDENVAGRFLLLVFTLLVSGFGLRLYFYLVQRYPNAKGWIATSSILINQIQVVVVIRDLIVVDGTWFQTLSGYMSLFVIDVGAIQPPLIRIGPSVELRGIARNVIRRRI